MLFSCGIVQATISESQARQWIATARRSALVEQIRRCTDQILLTRTQLGASVPDEEFRESLDQAVKNNWAYLIRPKWSIGRLFTNLETLEPRLAELPEHTLIRPYLQGTQMPPRHLCVEWLEENAYSDMAVAWNNALASRDAALSEPEPSPSGATGPRRREHVAMVRLTIQSALRFLAFLNGAAMNWFCKHRNVLDVATCSILLEWDDHKKRATYLSLCQKVFKYSHVFASARGTPINSTDPDVQYLASTAVPVRHALTRVSGRPSPGRAVDLSCHHQGHKLHVAEHTVDVCVRLAQRIADVAYTSKTWLYWLRPRETGGAFEVPGTPPSWF